VADNRAIAFFGRLLGLGHFKHGRLKSSSHSLVGFFAGGAAGRGSAKHGIKKFVDGLKLRNFIFVVDVNVVLSGFGSCISHFKAPFDDVKKLFLQ
jgi:hypothetical protein